VIGDGWRVRQYQATLTYAWQALPSHTVTLARAHTRAPPQRRRSHSATAAAAAEHSMQKRLRENEWPPCQHQHIIMMIAAASHTASHTVDKSFQHTSTMGHNGHRALCCIAASWSCCAVLCYLYDVMCLVRGIVSTVQYSTHSSLPISPQPPSLRRLPLQVSSVQG
jgi:hypothetical protein